ncbi:phage tail protein [Pseudomonas sp. YeP6b]|uniref:phage tail protein n=1 Tax=Pseudomonas sp. YeP6b TaxID=2861775 RepID=UPI0021D8B335|nr:phage tail protein [Pseudomonas sp. YeP6b]UXZ21383.1 phage tail protein [Pseudomonas sp. YeP6b]
MGASITLAGESLIAQKTGAQQRLDVVRFVFANVPGLNPNAPVDRAAAKPPAAQIVHTYTIPKQNIGFVNPNQVVYSSMLGSDIGDFDWNWIGLETAENVLLAVAYVPVQQKRKNIPPLQVGNNVTRNILVVFDGAQALTGITIDASTWQHDFTVRLKGIDERERLSNRDVFGRACFYRSGLQVEKVASGYQLKPGLGYVEGIRVEQTSALPFAPPGLPSPVWLKVSLRRELNDVLASWTVVFDPNQVDYLDTDGAWHYSVPLAYLLSANQINDLRTIAPIDGPLVDHFAAKVGHYPDLRSGSATKLANPRAINGVAFDGTQDITVRDATKLPLTGGTMTGDVVYAAENYFGSGWARGLTFTSGGNTVGSIGGFGTATGFHTLFMGLGADGYATGNGVRVSVDGVVITGLLFGNGGGLVNLNASALTAGTVPRARLYGAYDVQVTGNAGSATRLETARLINGVAFDGTQNIAIGDGSKLPLSGGTLTGGVRFNVPMIGGSFVSWQERQTAIQIDCAANGAAYSVWKGTNWSERHLAAMEVYAGGTSTSIPSVVMHVGATFSAFTLDGSGHLTIKGSYFGDGGQLSGLNANALTLGTLAKARLNGTYDIAVSGNAATSTKLATPRLINGVSFDGTANIAIADNSKLPLGGGTLTGSAVFDFPAMAGGFVDWRSRSPAVQINCANNGGAYLMWKATNWAERHLASMDVYAGGGSVTPPSVVMHVGGTNNALTLSEGGNLRVTGSYSGDASGLTNLPQATPEVPGAVLKNNASLGPNGWWKCAQTGLIRQWGITLGASDTVTHRSFPIASPTAACLWSPPGPAFSTPTLPQARTR